MYVYDKTAVAREHRLTITMCLALLGVGTVKRMATVRALEARGLVETTDHGWYLTEGGRRVADLLPQQALSVQEAATPEEAAGPYPENYSGPVIGDTVTDGTDHGMVRELAGRSGTLGAVVEFPEGSRWVPIGDLSVQDIETEGGPIYPEGEDAGAHVESDHEPDDRGWPPLYDGPVPEAAVIEPQTTVASEITPGDVIVWAGDRWPVLAVGATPDATTLRVEGRTLTMSPMAPVRRAATAQLSRIGA